uniref:Uncharacterized protein n=1 Tax=Rhizophora mucronata TaxID=61149 RepID=A0A2P2NI96_RHIMU
MHPYITTQKGAMSPKHIISKSILQHTRKIYNWRSNMKRTYDRKI